MSTELERLRKQIDLADRAIIQAIADRMRIAEKIGVHKKARGIASLDMSRWKKTVKTRAALARSLNVPEALIKNVYDLIHSAALELERKI